MIMAKNFDYKSIDASTPSGVGKMMTEVQSLGKKAGSWYPYARRAAPSTV